MKKEMCLQTTLSSHVSVDDIIPLPMKRREFCFKSREMHKIGESNLSPFVSEAEGGVALVILDGI